MRPPDGVYRPHYDEDADGILALAALSLFLVFGGIITCGVFQHLEIRDLRRELERKERQLKAATLSAEYTPGDGIVCYSAAPPKAKR